MLHLLPSTAGQYFNQLLQVTKIHPAKLNVFTVTHFGNLESIGWYIFEGLIPTVMQYFTEKILDKLL